ncbi:MAG: ECF transporter S component [Clostridiales bacterium]|nr:ECF transporter S component [Clostridiales bacterium]
MERKQKNKTVQLCITALFMALTCIFTMVIRVPIPLGYAHLGNSIIFLAVFYFSTTGGIIAGSIGSAMADLLSGFSQWIIPTLIIKAALAFTAAVIGKKKQQWKLFSLRTIIAVTLSMAVMVIGYTVSGAIMYGGIAAGLASTPGLIAEGVVNIIAFYLFAAAFSKVKVKGDY